MTTIRAVRCFQIAGRGDVLSPEERQSQMLDIYPEFAAHGPVQAGDRIEALFGEAKQWHGMRQFRLRGLMKVNMEGLMIAAGQNLKRLLSAKGWGRRPWPDGAAGFAGLTAWMCFPMG